VNYRGAFLKKLAGIAGGAAAASALLPMLEPNYAWGQQIAPDDPGLETGYVEYASGGGSVRAYLAKPAGSTEKLPGILVIHENRGLNRHIEDVARVNVPLMMHYAGNDERINKSIPVLR
jgi:carboxymethylenebutenolidase